MSNPASFFDVASDLLVLNAGNDDDDRGIRLGIQGEAFPRLALTPDGRILHGDGTVEPAVPFLPFTVVTGVAVTAAGVHAALVTLGLITGP